MAITKHRDESEWVVGEGEYEKLKTPEEHKRILEILARNNKIPRKSRAGTFPTSGIMYCKRCGYRMSYSVGKYEVKSEKNYNFTKCNHKDPFGVKCSQRGVKMNEEFYSAIYSAIITRHLDREHLEQLDENKELNSRRKEILKDRQSELTKAEKTLKKVMDAYENDAYTLEQYLERKKPHEASINSLNKEIAELRREDQYKSKYSTSQMKRKIEWFKREWAKVSCPKDQNVLLKSIVKKIYYDRDEDTVTLDIEYN